MILIFRHFFLNLQAIQLFLSIIKNILFELEMAIFSKLFVDVMSHIIRFNAGKKIKSIFELFIMQKNESKFGLFSIVQTLAFIPTSHLFKVAVVQTLKNYGVSCHFTFLKPNYSDKKNWRPGTGLLNTPHPKYNACIQSYNAFIFKLSWTWVTQREKHFISYGQIHLPH